MKKHILSITCILVFSFQSYANESGYIYNSLSKSNDNSIYYNHDSNQYIVKNELGEFKYERRNFKRMLANHISTFEEGDRQDIERIVTEHAQISIVSKPNIEEVLSTQLEILNHVDDYLSANKSDCYENKGIPKDGISLDIEDTSKLVDMEMESEGFIGLGKLKAFKLDLITNNDNPLHGALGAAGVTTWAEGIEGDDRGLTFGYGASASAEFEKGELTLRKTSKGYGRLKPQEGNRYFYNGEVYTSTVYNDEDGKRYQEFLSIDSTEIEIKRAIGSNETYIKVIGRQKTMDDTTGDSKSVQEAWHDSTDGFKDNAVQYHYLDYMEKRSGVEAYVEVGKKINLYDKNDVEISSTPYVGVQASSLGDSERMIQAGGDLKVVFNGKDQTNQKFPSWEVRLYGEAKKYADDESGYIAGASVTKRFKTSTNSNFYIKAGADYNHDRYSVAYGKEELDRHGRLDIDHQLGIGFEYRFK